MLIFFRLQLTVSLFVYKTRIMKTSPKHQKTYWNILDKKQFQNEILKKMKTFDYNWLKKISNWSMIVQIPVILTT